MKKKIQNRKHFRTTPKPADRTIYNPGIQEKDTSYLLTSPIIYHIAQQSVIVRTCTTTKAGGIQKRIPMGRKVREKRCKDCGKEHQSPVEQCVECGSMNLEKPNPEQLQYDKSS